VVIRQHAAGVLRSDAEEGERARNKDKGKRGCRNATHTSLNPHGRGKFSLSTFVARSGSFTGDRGHGHHATRVAVGPTITLSLRSVRSRPNPSWPRSSLECQRLLSFFPRSPTPHLLSPWELPRQRSRDVDTRRGDRTGARAGAGDAAAGRGGEGPGEP
jgi:hypothetical protein